MGDVVALGAVEAGELGRGEGDGGPEQGADRVAPAGGAPLSVETGTSTAGVRTPPMTLPCASSANVAGSVLDSLNGGGLGGGVPLSTHLSKAVKPASTTLCCGPLFTGVVQPRMLARGADEVGVGVGRAGDLPGTDLVGVGLLGRGIAQLNEVGLGFGHEDRDLQVGADAQVVRAAARRDGVRREGRPNRPGCG